MASNYAQFNSAVGDRKLFHIAAAEFNVLEGVPRHRLYQR
jgi:hypothetical protein